MNKLSISLQTLHMDKDSSCLASTTSVCVFQCFVFLRHAYLPSRLLSVAPALPSADHWLTIDLNVSTRVQRPLVVLPRLTSWRLHGVDNEICFLCIPDQLNCFFGDKSRIALCYLTLTVVRLMLRLLHLRRFLFSNTTRLRPALGFRMNKRVKVKQLRQGTFFSELTKWAVVSYNEAWKCLNNWTSRDTLVFETEKFLQR